MYYYMFILMGSGWHGKKITRTKTADLEAHVANGDPVVFTDDIDAFTELMKIEKDDITW